MARGVRGVRGVLREHYVNVSIRGRVARAWGESQEGNEGREDTFLKKRETRSS